MVEFLELDINPKYDGLFGSPILKDLNADINFSDNTIKINGLIIPLEYESNRIELSNELEAYLNNITVKEDLYHTNIRRKSINR